MRDHFNDSAQSVVRAVPFAAIPSKLPTIAGGDAVALKCSSCLQRTSLSLRMCQSASSSSHWWKAKPSWSWSECAPLLKGFGAMTSPNLPGSDQQARSSLCRPGATVPSIQWPTMGESDAERQALGCALV